MGKETMENQPLSFDDWKETCGLKYDEKFGEFMLRQYSEDYKAQWEEMIKREYQEYLGDFNGNWLL